MMLGSWMGTDFTNDDLVKESSLRKDFDAAHRSALGRRRPAGGSRSTVKPDVVGRWARIEILVSDDELPVEERHFDRKGRLARTMVFDEIKVLGGRRLPVAPGADADRHRRAAHGDALPRHPVRRADPRRHLQPVAARAESVSDGRRPRTSRIAWRNLWRNRRRTALALAAIGLSVALVLVYDGMLRWEGDWMLRDHHRPDARPRAGARAGLAPDARDGPDAARRVAHRRARCGATRRSPASTARVYAPALAALGEEGFAVIVHGRRCRRESRAVAPARTA